MTDVAMAETVADAVPVPPAPEIEAETAPPEADVPASPDTRALPGIEHPIGPLRQAIVDHLLDTDEPQSVAQTCSGATATPARW
jgi:hypothetical protein